MPLQSGTSAKTRSTNIREMMRSFKQTGRIGNTKPGSISKAVKIAAAAAYRKAGEGKRRGYKLSCYNGALGHLEQRRLASLSEGREPRYVLDDYWDKNLAYCLERHFWNFAYRAVQVAADSVNAPSFGYLYQFRIPVDWVRTRKISSSPTFDSPLLQFAEETGFWFANLTPLFVQYNSNDPQYGLNLGAWPASFADYVEKRLARLACKRITGSTELLAGPEGLIAEEKKARRVAAANCAMNEAVGFAPTGSWVRARRGFGTGPGPGGDSPTGGSLIP